MRSFRMGLGREDGRMKGDLVEGGEDVEICEFSY